MRTESPLLINLDTTKLPRRDLRIDLFRGLILINILIVHMGSAAKDMVEGYSGALPSVVTLGLTTSAELFVLLSGYAFGLVYWKSLTQKGIWVTQLRAIHRCTQLLMFHLLTFCLFVSIFYVFTDPSDNAKLLEWARLEYYISDPIKALTLLVATIHEPKLFSILPLYIHIIIIAPLLLWLIHKNVWLALTLSFGLYLTAQINPEWIVRDPLSGNRPGWNVLAWQFIFFIGMYLGHEGKLASLGQNRWGIPKVNLPLIMAISCIVIVYVLKLAGGLHLKLPAIDRWNLEGLRLLHNAAVVWIVLNILPQSEALTQSRWVMPFVKLGQQSLEAFCLHILLVAVTAIYMHTVQGHFITYLILVLIGTALMLGYAQILTFIKRNPWKSKTTLR